MAKLTTQLVEKLLRKHDGNLAAVGRAAGVTRTAVGNFIERHESLKPVLQETRETMKDGAESSLYNAAKAGESWAVCFYLKCQAKDRGYVERTEHAGTDGQPLSITIINVHRPPSVELNGHAEAHRSLPEIGP